MSKLRNILSGILLAALLAIPVSVVPTVASAAAPARHSSSTRSHKRNSRPKTVHVRSYKKKNGTVVKAHNRAAPERN